VKLRLLLSTLSVIAVLMASCGGKDGGIRGIEEPTCAPQGTTLHLLARSTRFGVNCLAVPARVPFTVNLDNQDAGVPHSFVIYDRDPAADPSAKALFSGGAVTGPSMRTYQVRPLSRGRLHFRCDVHPDRMFGTFLVGD
jgi:hypothetical protein